MTISFTANMESVGSGGRRGGGASTTVVSNQFLWRLWQWRGSGANGGMVDGVKRERLHKGRRLRAMGGDGGGRPIRMRRAGAEILL